MVTNSIRSIANKSDGVGRLIPSPAIVQDPGWARSLYRERTISINLDAMNHRCPIVVGVGTVKAFPIYTVLKNGFAKVAIMDASLAQTILELDSYRNR